MTSLGLHSRVSVLGLHAKTSALNFSSNNAKLPVRAHSPIFAPGEAAVLRFNLSSRELSGSKHSALMVRASSLELAPPRIDSDLHEIMRDMGAKISEDGVIDTFNNDDEAIEAAENGGVVIEMPHFGRLQVTGNDRLHILHNQSTADFKSMKEGQGCYTVFTTPTARTIDLAAAWVMKKSVILVVSPSKRKGIYDRLNKYMSFADEVEVEDITDKTHFFSITGPSSDEVEGTPVTVGVGSGLAGKGYTMMLSTATAGVVWEALMKAGAVPMGSAARERLRILQGRPAAASELTDEFNVLEAGLYGIISLTKGLYIGQETVANLITYDGVKQSLWGIELDGAASPGTLMTVGGQKVGQLTSCTTGKDKSKHFGLGYIRRKAGGAGLHADVDGVAGLVVDIPFVKRSMSDT